MDHSYAEQKLTLLLRDLSQYSADEFRRQMARIISGATGQDIPDDCHLTKAERNALAKEVDEANDRIGALTEERDEFAASNMAWNNAFDALFVHCCSNGVFNAWGIPFNCTSLNNARMKNPKLRQGGE